MTLKSAYSRVTHNSTQRQAGFTLTELLVVVAIVGILASMGVSSWIGFMNRQRVRVIQNATYQSLHEANREARSRKIEYCVTFGIEASVPKVAFHSARATASQWEVLNSAIEPGQVVLFMSGGQNGRVCFDHKGNTNDVGATLYMQVPDAESTRLCVSVGTMLGKLHKGNGYDCPGSMNNADGGNFGGGNSGGGGSGGGNSGGGNSGGNNGNNNIAPPVAPQAPPSPNLDPPTPPTPPTFPTRPTPTPPPPPSF